MAEFKLYENLLRKQYLKMVDKAWDRLYFGIDVHEVCLESNYNGISDTYCPYAKEGLQLLSSRPEICMIMWTASNAEDKLAYKEFFAKDGIRFDYINENPEISGSVNWGDYDSKMYLNVGLDDKFGFVPEIHWPEIINWYSQKQIELNLLCILNKTKSLMELIKSYSVYCHEN